MGCENQPAPLEERRRMIYGVNRGLS